MQRHQAFQKEPSEQPRQDPHGQKEPGAAADPPRAIRRQSPSGHDDSDMRVMRQRRSPCVQHAGHADACAEPLGIGRDRAQRLGRCPKQQVIDSLLVPVGDLSDLGRQGEDHVEIFHGQQIRGAGGHPIPRRRSLALRTVPVLAGNGRRPLPALWADPVMGSQRRLDRAFAPVAAVRLTITKRA